MGRKRGKTEERGAEESVSGAVGNGRKSGEKGQEEWGVNAKGDEGVGWKGCWIKGYKRRSG